MSQAGYKRKVDGHKKPKQQSIAIHKQPRSGLSGSQKLIECLFLQICKLKGTI